MNVIELAIDKVVPYWHNPRNNEKTVERLAVSIRDFGFNVPLVLDKNYVVITGHARLKAAKKLGLATVPCVITDLDERKAKKYRIADNKIQELTDWQEDALFKELQEIGDKMELLEIGFNMGEIEKAVGSFEDLEEVLEEVEREEEDADVVEVVAVAPAAVGMSVEEKAKLEEQLRKREAELAGRFVKESYEEHAKDNLIACPHCGKSFKVRGLS